MLSPYLCHKRHVNVLLPLRVFTSSCEKELTVLMGLIFQQNMYSLTDICYCAFPSLLCLPTQGFKFDLRLYVVVTSYDPLRVYLFSEGLARFATVPYDPSLRDLRDLNMHLTNYSINKESLDYVRLGRRGVPTYVRTWLMPRAVRVSGCAQY